MNKFTALLTIILAFLLLTPRSYAQGVAINTTGSAPLSMLHVAQSNASNNILEILRIERSNTGAGGNGIGVTTSFYLEDGGSTVEKAAGIDVVYDDATNTSEDASITLNAMQNGSIIGVATFNTSWGPFMEFNHAGATATNTTIETMRVVRQVSGGNGANNIGQKWTMYLENANGTQKDAAEIASTLVDATNTSEDSDFKITTLIGGAFTNTLGIWETGNVAIGSSTPSAKLHVQLAENSTNTILNLLKLTRANSGGNGANGIGGTLIYELEDNGGNIETAASMDVQYEDATNGSEKATISFGIKQAGSIAELLRLDGTDQNVGIGQSVPTAKLHVFGSDDGNNTMPMLRLERLRKTGNGQANNGGAIQYLLEDDAGNSENMVSLDAVLDVATNAGNAEEATLRFLTKVGGVAAVAEQMRIDGTKGYVGIGISAPVSRLHVGEDLAANNTIASVMNITRSTTNVGNGANGIGLALNFELEDDAGNLDLGGKIEMVYDRVNNTTEDASMRFFTMNDGTMKEMMRVYGDDGGYLKTNGGRVVNTSTKSADYSLTNGDYFIIAASGGAVRTMTLPASPVQGQLYWILRNGANNVVVARNGKNINGAAADFTITNDLYSVGFIYDGAGWLTIKNY